MTGTILTGRKLNTPARIALCLPVGRQLGLWVKEASDAKSGLVRKVARLVMSAVDAGGVTCVSHIPDLDVGVVRHQAEGSRASVSVHGQESGGQNLGSHPSFKEVGGPAGVRIRGIWTTVPIRFWPRPTHRVF